MSPCIWGLQLLQLPSLILQNRNTDLVVTRRPLASTPLSFESFSSSIQLFCRRKSLSCSQIHFQPQIFSPNSIAPITAHLPLQDEGLPAPENSEDFGSYCELYVCNLPRSCGVSELLELFKPFGIIQSVEVSRNAETGTSRGCGYVAMSTIHEAKAVIAALDGSDVSGREMRVRFSIEITRGRNSYDLEATQLATKRDLIFESPYKIYVGNLAWSVKPADLRNLFSQFGTVVSVRVLHDQKSGKRRVYGFLSFSSATEREAAMSLNGTDFCGRKLLVRDALEKN